MTWLEESIEYETINDEKGSILHYDSMYAITLGNAHDLASYYHNQYNIYYDFRMVFSS